MTIELWLWSNGEEESLSLSLMLPFVKKFKGFNSILVKSIGSLLILPLPHNIDIE